MSYKGFVRMALALLLLLLLGACDTMAPLVPTEVKLSGPKFVLADSASFWRADNGTFECSYPLAAEASGRVTRSGEYVEFTSARITVRDKTTGRTVREVRMGYDEANRNFGIIYPGDYLRLSPVRVYTDVLPVEINIRISYFDGRSRKTREAGFIGECRP